MDIKSSYICKIASVVILFSALVFQTNISLAAKSPKSAVVYMYDDYFSPETNTI